MRDAGIIIINYFCTENFFFFFQKQKKNEKKNVLNSVLENVLVSNRIIISLLVIKHSKHNSSSV